VKRTGWLAVTALGALGLGAAVRLTRPNPNPALPCAPDAVRWFDAGTALVARCAPPGTSTVTPAAQALVVGQKLDLRTASEEDLEVLPGVGPSLARRLVEARAAHPFETWDDVDRIPGVGPGKLALLKANTRLAPSGQ
jgi:competence protein ComEA